jgi:hypothetical protein
MFVRRPDDIEKSKLLELAIGRILQLWDRPTQPGDVRSILRDGVPFVTIQRCDDTHPGDADEIARRIVPLLNESES